MKKIIVIVIIGLLISVGLLSGCIEDGSETRKFDNGNILVVHDSLDVSKNDYLLITIFTKGNYTIYISYVSTNNEMKSKTLYFEVCNIPYQYRFESWCITDYELKIINKDYW